MIYRLDIYHKTYQGNQNRKFAKQKHKAQLQCCLL